MYTQHSEGGYRQLLPGIFLKTLAYGEKTLLGQFRLEKGSLLPRHSHPHEQTGYCISGYMRLTIGSEVFEVAPGDGWCVPANLEHSAEILEECLIIEVFSPVREDYLPKIDYRTQFFSKRLKETGSGKSSLRK